MREFQFQMGERDKFKLRHDEDMEKLEQKINRMKQQIIELENSEGSLQLAKRRAERESMEYKDKSLR